MRRDRRRRSPATVQLGGGLRIAGDVETAFAPGVDRVVVGTAVVQDRDLLEWAIDRLGRRAIAAASTPARASWRPHGWPETDRRRGRDRPSPSAMGVAHLIYTDIRRDGTLGGPNLAPLRELAEAAPPLR